MSDKPLDTLNSALQKSRVKPTYEIILSNNETSTNEFVTRLTCPIATNGGAFLITEGSALSKKEAKRNAARAFIYKYLTIGKDDDLASVPPEFVKLTNNIPIADRSIVLEIICSTNKLMKPDYVEIAVTGTFRSPCFTVECRVSYLRGGGRGGTRTDAESEAALKMIQLLMGVESIYQMINSRYSLAETIDDAEAVPSEGGSSVPSREEKTANSKPAELETSPSSRLLHFQSARVFSNPIVRRKLLKSVNMKDPEGSDGNKSDAKRSISKISCNINDAVRDAKSNGVCRNLTSLQLISKIDRILEGFEKQLLETLMYSSGPSPKSVSILDKEYEVCLDRFSQPKIFQGDCECNDKSIRVACLVKILLELKEDVKYKGNKLVQ